jgi:hypothetical protein
MAIWNLQSPSRLPKGASTMVLQLNANSENGALSGTLTYNIGMEGEANGLTVNPPGGQYLPQSPTYSVQGSWTASGNQPGKAFTVFSLSGNNGTILPTFIAAVGTMTGPGDNPTAIQIEVNTASSEYGTLTQDTLNLIPAA